MAAGPAAALAAALALTVALSSGALGIGWTAPARVTDSRPSELTALHELTSVPGALHLVHARIGPKPADDRVVYQRSTNGARTWSREQILFRSTKADPAVVPNLAIAAEDQLVAVAWRTRGDHGSSLWIRRSEDGGRTWKPRQLLAQNGQPRGIGVPALSVAGGRVIAAWTLRSKGKVLARRSTDGARTWGKPVTLGTTHLSIDCDRATLDGLVGLGASGDTVHLAWSDGKDGACLSNKLLVRTSRDGGRTWGAARTASTTKTYGWPEVTARGPYLLISLQEPDGGFTIVRSRNSGRTFKEHGFTPAKDRALGAADVLLPGGATAWLVYADVLYDANDVASSRIRFRTSHDRGATWSAGQTVVDTASKLRQAANLAAAGSKPVILFQTGKPDGSTADIVAVRAR